MKAAHKLTQAQVDRIAGRSEGGLFLDIEPVDPPPQDRINATAHEALDQWLKGTAVTGRTAKPSTPSSTSDAHDTPSTRQFDRIVESQPLPQLPTGLRHRTTAQPRLTLNDLRHEVKDAADCYRVTVDRYSDLAEQAVSGANAKLNGAAELVGPFVDMIRMDPALPLLLIDLEGDREDYLFAHGVNAALLSMTVANSLGYERHDVMDVGIGALFQDIGMLRVPAEIRFAPRTITRDERLVIERHPISSVDILERASALSQTALLVAYQAHERNDRSGYPRGRHERSIHPLARVVNVSDTYAALTCTRPHRRAVSPYEAVTTLLHEASDGRLDREVVRSFLDCICLFPIGSYVELSDGMIARVLRNNGSAHTQPVVVPLNADGSETDVEVDLKRLTGLHVVRAMNHHNPIIGDDPKRPTGPSQPPNASAA